MIPHPMVPINQEVLVEVVLTLRLHQRLLEQAFQVHQELLGKDSQVVMAIRLQLITQVVVAAVLVLRELRQQLRPPVTAEQEKNQSSLGHL